MKYNNAWVELACDPNGSKFKAYRDMILSGVYVTPTGVGS